MSKFYKGASPNYFGKVNVIFGGGGGGVQARDVFRCTDQKKMAAGLPHPSISMTLWGGGGLVKRQNDVIFSKMV